jgi:hypothetical protein
MTDKTKQLIDQAVNDRNSVDSLRGDVKTQQENVKAADDQLAKVQADALAAHNTALTSAHAAIDALSGEVES